MNKIKEYKYYIIAIFIFAIILLLPPILHSAKYMIINGDTQAHLNIFNQLKNGGHPVYLYIGQSTTAQLIVWLNSITNISIETLFMWFNFIMLLVGGIVMSMIIMTITKNKLAGILSMFLIIFGTTSITQLFFSGTIFNIIDIIVIFPLFILSIWKLINTKQLLWILLIIPLGFLVAFYHPSLGDGINLLFKNTLEKETIISPVATIISFLGIINFIIAILSVIIITTRKNNYIPLATKVILVLINALGVMFTILTFMNITPFSARTLFNACIMFTIGICIIIGIAIKNNNKIIQIGITLFVFASILPNLIGWLSFPNYKEVLSVIIH